MNSAMKGIAIAAGAMLVVGAIFTGIGLLSGGNQPFYLDTDGVHVGKSGADGRLEAFAKNVDEFDRIDVNLDYYDIQLIPGDKYYVEGKFLTKEGMPEISVKNGELQVSNNNTKGVQINLNMPGLINETNMPVLKIYYPEGTRFDDVAIQCDMADLSFDSLEAGQTEFTLDSGNLDLTDIKADEMKVEMDSGNCTLSKIGVKGLLEIKNDLGNITLNEIDANKLNTATNSGNVTMSDVTATEGVWTVDLGKLTGQNLKTEDLQVSADSGDINLQGMLGGSTEITCDLGSVTVTPDGKEDDYNYELKADLGSINVNGMSASGSVSATSNTAKNTLKVKTDSGSITVDFQ